MIEKTLLLVQVKKMRGKRLGKDNKQSKKRHS